MSDENSASAVVAQQSVDPVRLAAENADLRSRLAALEQQNVVDGRFHGEAPKYQLTERGFYEDTFYEAGTILEWLDPPNLSMAPLNEPARRALQQEIDRQTEGARRVAARNGRDFMGLMTDRNVLIDLARMDAKAVADAPTPVIAMPTVHAAPPTMPHLAQQERRGPGRPRKVLSATPPAPMAPGPDLGTPMLAPAPTDSAIVGRRVG